MSWIDLIGWVVSINKFKFKSIPGTKTTILFVIMNIKAKIFSFIEVQMWSSFKDDAGLVVISTDICMPLVIISVCSYSNAWLVSVGFGCYLCSYPHATPCMANACSGWFLRGCPISPAPARTAEKVATIIMMARSTMPM